MTIQIRRLSDVQELHYIISLGNIESVLKNGILSYSRSSKIEHTSIADNDVRERRLRKFVPNGRNLGEYVNLYFNARNPMMYRLKPDINRLCILIISADIIQKEDCVLTDGNAACDYVRFLNYNEASNKLNFEYIYIKYWNDNDPIKKAKKTFEIMAEVLVADCVHNDYIIGAYVPNNRSLDVLKQTGFNKEIVINPNLFFEA